MTGWRGVPEKQRRELRRRNHIARDLRTPKYNPRVRESNRQHLIDELHEQEARQAIEDDYEWLRRLGLTCKE